MFSGGLSLWHWLIVAIVLIVLFGSKKLPDAARGLGRSMRIFKSEIEEMQKDGDKTAPSSDDAAQRELPPSPSAADVAAKPVTDPAEK